MKSLSFFKSATVFLLLLNLVLIFFLFLGRPKKHDAKKMFNNEVVKILNLNRTQEDEFNTLSVEHNEAIKKLDAERSTILQPYFHNLFLESKSNLSRQDSLIERFQAIEKEKVEFTRDHFLQVKKILNPEQEKNMDPFLKRAVKILFSDKKPPPKPHK